ncbi:MAG: hypothetical protein COT74_09600 [Bdellovibrionales bacterium CG10_big_fil_rev_8_21_14_0_10_45_34]|nr:MAG: hypothetical protein COT74_09600 [Bdellovibrionales bacterium CG10_big_fil_rev_8_21_14_0_10_45_34]
MCQAFLVGELIVQASNANAEKFFENEMSYSNLQQKLLQDNELTSVEAFLDFLPESYKENPIIIGDSKSIQYATPTSPRILLPNADASIVFTFNGSEEHSGGSTVEAYEFDRIKRRFNFFAIDFSSGKGVLSQKNPALCLGCHAPDPRPNWEHYPNWKGVYGDRDDYLKFEDKSKSLSELDFSKWLQDAGKHPRYSFLKLPIVNFMLPGGKTFVVNFNLPTLLEKPFDLFLDAKYIQFEERINSDFTQKVVELNALRLVRIIEEHGNDDQTADEVLDFLLNVVSSEEILSGEKTWQSEVPISLIKKLKPNRSPNYYQDRFDNHASGKGDISFEEDRRTMPALMMALDLIGYSDDRWATGFIIGHRWGYRMTTPLFFSTAVLRKAILDSSSKRYQAPDSQVHQPGD